MKIATVVGARPQFIKAATVSRVVAKIDNIQEVIIHTGQHYDLNMSDIFFSDLDIPRPNYHLGIRETGHGAMTGRMLEQIEAVLVEENPDIVLVYGDTNSTLAGALAAAKLHIKLAHIEAGLRSFNRRMPEEINRILTDHVADILFAPSEVAIDNLTREGLPGTKLHLIGDVMYDAALFYKHKGVEPTWFSDCGVSRQNFILATIHRAENTDDAVRLKSIFDGIADSGQDVVLPLHPRTRDKLKTFHINPSKNVKLVEPVGYLEMVWLETNATCVATDSGGVQKEAYFHGKPCVTFRDETEWPELVTIGANRLVGANRDQIAEALAKNSSLKVSKDNIYGDGYAAEKILDILK